MTKFELKPEEFMGKVANGIGLVAPFDFALDDEYRLWLPHSTPLFTTRTPELEDTSVTVTLAKEVGSELAVVPAIRSLLAVRPAAIGYACTSGSFINGVAGEKHLLDIMVKAGAPAAVTTSGALVQALHALGVRKVAIATPYNQELTESLREFLRESGFGVVSSGYLNMEHDIARVSTSAVIRMAEAIDRPDAEAIFFSCTNLHTYEIIKELEYRLGKPVLSANQVTVWAALQAGHLTLPVVDQRLFSINE